MRKTSLIKNKNTLQVKNAVKKLRLNFLLYKDLFKKEGE